MFSLRKFTSLCITFSFIIMSYTGIMLFIVPQGKYAYWMHWELLGLTKTQYGNLHVTFMVLFVVGMLLHIYLNWACLVAYLKNKKKEFTLLTKEFMLAFGFTLVFLLGTLYETPPFKTFLQFNDTVKQSWVTQESTPPYGHAELSSLKSLTKKTFLDLEKSMQTLKDKGFTGIEENAQMEQIAIENGTTPAKVYALIDIEENEVDYQKEDKATQKKTSSSSSLPQMGGGLGQMSLEEVSKRYGINLEEALKKLGAKGVQANKDSRMKPLAEELNTTPFDLFDLIK